jgi:hypothetical protein
MTATKSFLSTLKSSHRMSDPADVANRLETEKIIGLSLALASGVLIGVSFIITKKGLIDANRQAGMEC